MDKYKEIQKVLIITLLLNVSVAAIKLFFGFLFSISTLIADGLHSSSDSINNIVGMIAVRFAKKRSDEKHPYGYEKYETIATFIIAVIISILAYQTLCMGIGNFQNKNTVLKFEWYVYFSVIGTICFNIITVFYEGHKGIKLNSEFLIADSKETKGDILISAGVFIGMILMGIFPELRLDAVLPIIISFFIFKNALEIFREITKILTDTNIVGVKDIYEVVMSHPEVIFCHAIRSRGKSDAIFIDFHLGVDKDISIKHAHDIISHEVKLMLKEKIRGLKSVFIHIEPDTAIDRNQSVFKDADF